MKAITLWQPWATLIAIGVKRFETRSWATHHRGQLAIHAAKRQPTLAECSVDIRGALHMNGYKDLSSLPYGCVVCVVDLVGMIPTDKAILLPPPGSHEYAFGDFSPGRFAWELANVRPIDNIPATGSQGFWNWTPPEGVML